MTSPRLYVAVEIDATHGKEPADGLWPRSTAAVVASAAGAGFTFATFADSPLPPDDGFPLDATTRLASVATLTDRIGPTPTSTVATAEPLDLATRLASLAPPTGTRAGWSAPTPHPKPLATVGREPLGPDASRREVADVVELRGGCGIHGRTTPSSRTSQPATTSPRTGPPRRLRRRDVLDDRSAHHAAPAAGPARHPLVRRRRRRGPPGHRAHRRLDRRRSAPPRRSVRGPAGVPPKWKLRCSQADRPAAARTGSASPDPRQG